MEWIVVIILSVVFVFLWQTVVYVIPAMRQAIIAENMLTLSSCLLELNKNDFPEAKIKSGSFIHDKFYRFLLLVLCNSNIRLPRTAPNIDTRRMMQQFDDEANTLGKQTRKSISNAMISVSKILFAKHPVSFILLFLKVNHKEKSYRKGLIVSGKYLTVTV